MSKVYEGESGYIQLIKDVLIQGHEQYNKRTSSRTLSLFDAKVVFPEGDFNCFSTVKPASLRLAFEELWFFLRGETNTKQLEEKGVMFWRGNTSREFLDNRGLKSLPEGDLGAAYSSQFRRFGSHTLKGKKSKGTDQLLNLLRELKEDPQSRRLMIDLWNPAEHYAMCLTPCWFNFQVVVIGDYLHMKLRNRSLDCVFGFSFAVQQYRLLQLCLCKMFDYKLGKLSCDLSHTHVYFNQIDYAKEMVERSLGTQGEVSIKKELLTPEDLLSLAWQDFEVTGLKVNTLPFKNTRPEMVA